MAKYDVVKIKGKSWLALSNDQSVGVGSVNETGDVMLIQAMLRYISPFKIGGYASPIVPEVNGIFDAATGEAIRNFQSYFSSRLIVTDGVIHSPSYVLEDSVRDLKDPYKPLMTHTFLHIVCRNTAQFYAHMRYPEGITMLIPKLHQYLKNSGLRTLNFLH